MKKQVIFSALVDNAYLQLHIMLIILMGVLMCSVLGMLYCSKKMEFGAFRLENKEHSPTTFVLSIY